jgi:hypothetical protein
MKETIHLWDVATGREVRCFRPGAYPVIYLAFTGNGKWLVSSATASGGSPVEVWTVATGQRFREFAAAAGRDNNWRESVPIALTPDGKLLATSGADNTVVVWELVTGQEVRRLKGHKGPVTALAFSPDGQALVSGSQDTTLLLWRLSAPESKKAAPPNAPAAKKLQACWDGLADEDAAVAYRAAWSLANARNAAVAFLKARLRPAGDRDPERIPGLVRDLGSAQAAVGEKAAAELRLFGAAAEPALYSALRKKLRLAVRQQVERLLEAIAESPIVPEELQRLRALQVLEWVGTPEAVAVLEDLAQGHATAPQTEDARGALRRVVARRQAAPIRVVTDDSTQERP